MTFGPTYQSMSHSVLQFPITFKLGMKYPKIPINGYSNLDFSISACGNRSSQFLIYWDTEWWNTVYIMTVYAAQFTFHFGHISSKKNISSFGKTTYELSEIKHIKSKSKTYPLIQSRCIRGLTNPTQPCQNT